MTCGYEDSFKHILPCLSMLIDEGDHQSPIRISCNFLRFALQQEPGPHRFHVVRHQLSHLLQNMGLKGSSQQSNNTVGVFMTASCVAVLQNKGLKVHSKATTQSGCS